MGGGPPHGQVAHGFTLMIPPSGCFNTDVSRFLYCFSAPVPLVRHSRWHLCLGSPGAPRKRLPGRARGPEPRAETAGREDLFRGTPPCLPQIHQPQEGAGAPCPVPLCKRKEVGPRALKPDSALQGTESSETWVRRHAGPHTGLGPSGWRPALETWLASVRDSREMGEGVHIPTPETAVRPGSGLSPRPPSRGRAPAKIRAAEAKAAGRPEALTSPEGQCAFHRCHRNVPPTGSLRQGEIRVHFLGHGETLFTCRRIPGPIHTVDVGSGSRPF